MSDKKKSGLSLPKWLYIVLTLIGLGVPVAWYRISNGNSAETDYDGPELPAHYVLFSEEDYSGPGVEADVFHTKVDGQHGALCVWNFELSEGDSVQTFLWNTETGEGEWKCQITDKYLGVVLEEDTLSGRLQVGKNPEKADGTLVFIMYEHDLKNLRKEIVKKSGILRPSKTDIRS